MPKKLVSFWIIISFAAIAIGFVWSRLDHDNHFAFLIYFNGWISSLLAIGYYSTPSNSMFGKIIYGFVVLTVVGIAFKILHYTGANEMIIVGLIGISITYVWMWIKSMSNDQ